MKHILPFLIAFLGSYTAFAQTPVTQSELPGIYQTAKMLLGDTLFYDVNDPAKSDRNILIEIGKYNPPIAVMEDSTLAIYLFYKDIKKSLQSTIVLQDDGTVESHLETNHWKKYQHSGDRWEFDQQKQLLIIKSKSKVKESYPVTRVNGKIVVTIEDKKEHTKIELVKLY